MGASMDIKIEGKAKGGIARAKSLSKEQRSEIAKKAAQERWSEKKAKATHSSTLKIGDLKIPCYVLDDSTRVLSGRGIMKLLGFTPSASGTALKKLFNNNSIAKYVNPAILDALDNPISFERPGAGGAVLDTYSYEATVLIDMCNTILESKSELYNQPALIANAELILRAVGKVGIIALVDEATGFQNERPQDALQVYLEQLISKELAAWVKKFPDEFYENIYKLKGWPWPGMSKNRYSVVGSYTRDLVFERIAPGLLPELEKRSPKDQKGNRANKLHQWLTADIGDPMLSQHMHSLIMFQRLAIASGYGWNRFVKMVDQVLPKKGHTLELPLNDTSSP